MRKSLTAIMLTLIILIASFGCTSADNPEVNTVGNIAGNIGYATIQGDWIFYMNYADDCKLYKTHTNGTAKIKLNDRGSANINVIGDWVYYFDKDRRLSKMRTDGTEITVLYDEKIDHYLTNSMNVTGDWIYFNGMEDGKIYRIRTDGTELQLAL